MKLITLILLLSGLANAQNLITSFSQTSLRSDYTGYVGMQFTVGAAPLTVTGLGRMCVAGNSKTHTVAVLTSAGVMITSVQVSMAGCTGGQFTFASIPPNTLNAGASYFIASLEAMGGDEWWDQGTVTLAAVASPVTSIYQYGTIWYPSTARATYGPVNLQYTGATPSPLPPPKPTTSYFFFGSGMSIVDVPCPAGWLGTKLPDGNCLALAVTQ